MTKERATGREPFFLRPEGLLLTVGVLTALKFFAAGASHFVEDEAYYRIWGLFPTYSYYDHPPMIGWWIAAGQTLFGDTVFAVRAPVIFMGMIGSLALWRTADILFGRKVAGWAVLLLNATILYGVGGILATPDAPSVFFWGLAVWALAELSRSQNAYWWLAVGLFAGLGLLSKYSLLFLGAGIVLWLVWVPEARRWWGCWQLWAGGVIAVFCFLPVVYWNHVHDWLSFYKQFGRAESRPFTTKYIFEYLGALIGLLNPLIAVLVALGVAALFRPFKLKDSAASLLILTSLPFFLYLLYHALHSRVQGNWPAPLFPVFAITAAYFVSGLSSNQRLWRNCAKAAVALGVAVTVLVQFHAVWPLTGAFARKDPTFQLRGWPEIGNAVSEIARKEAAGFVVTTSYGLNGQLDFLLKNSLPVIQLTERIRYVMVPEPGAELFGQAGLYVTEDRRSRAGWLEERFDTVELVADVQREVAGVPLETLLIYRVQGVLAPLYEPLSSR